MGLSRATGNPPYVERSVGSTRPDARWDAYCWFGLAIVGTAVCLYLFESRKNLITDLAAHGRHRTGVVTEATMSRGRRGTSYYIHYQYVLPVGIYEDSKQVSEREARQASPGDLSHGVDQRFRLPKCEARKCERLGHGRNAASVRCRRMSTNGPSVTIAYRATVPPPNTMVRINGT